MQGNYLFYFRIVATRPQVLGEEAIIKLSNPSAVMNNGVTNGSGSWQYTPFNASVVIPLPSQTNRYSGTTTPPLASQFPSFQSISTQVSPPPQHPVKGPAMMNGKSATDSTANHSSQSGMPPPEMETPDKLSTTEDDEANSSWTTMEDCDEEMDSSAVKQTTERSNEYEEMDGSNSESSNCETDEDPDPPTDEFETPPLSIIDDSAIVRRSPRTKGGATRNRHSIDIPADYRRFSGRSKKKTNFFGVLHQKSGRRGGGGGNRRSPMASKRALKFDKKNDLLLVNKVARPVKQSFVPPPPPPATKEPSDVPSEKKSSDVSA